MAVTRLNGTLAPTDAPDADDQVLRRGDLLDGASGLLSSRPLYVSAENWSNAGGGVDVLATYTIPADTINSTSLWSMVELRAFGAFADTVNTKMLRFKFGSLTLFTTTSAYADKTWDFTGQLYVASTGSVISMCRLILSDGTVILYDAAGTVTPSSALVAQWECTGVDNADIEQKSAAMILHRGASA